VVRSPTQGHEPSPRRKRLDAILTTVCTVTGIAALLTQLVVWTRFAQSGPHQIVTYRDPGSTTFHWAKAVEIALVVITIATIVVAARAAVRARRFTTNAMLLVGFASALWLDPMLNYFRPGFYFSQNLTNVDSWVRFLPGQLAPYSENSIVPPVWIFGAYVGVFLPVTLALSVLIKVLVRRWTFPHGMFCVFVVIVGAAMLIDLVFEAVIIRLGLMAYPAAPGAFALWAGTQFQLPLIELLGAGLFWTLLAFLVCSADQRGLTWVERGSRYIPGTAARAVVRQVALIGVVNALFLLLPLGIVQSAVLDTDPFPPGIPQHLTGDWCGDNGQPYGPCTHDKRG